MVKKLMKYCFETVIYLDNNSYLHENHSRGFLVVQITLAFTC